MIKTIKTFPRVFVEDVFKHKLRPSENWALISIWGEHEAMTFEVIDTLKTLGCKKILSSHFQDLTDEQFGRIEIARPGQKLCLFNNNNASQIINFINDIKDEVDDLFIHCAAGISRSGAVGLFACRYLGLDEEVFRKMNPHILPNFYVLKLLNEESGINADYVKFWETERNNELRRKIDAQFIFG